jgi:putative acetyltransferase
VLAEGTAFITTVEELDALGGVAYRRLVFEEIRRTAGAAMWVARHGGRLVGWLSVRPGPLAQMRHCGKIEVMVAAEARGRGVGTALLAACVAWAEQEPSLTKLGLAVFDDNQRALGLYRRFGFVQEGHRPDAYRSADGRYRGDYLMGRRV